MRLINIKYNIFFVNFHIHIAKYHNGLSNTVFFIINSYKINHSAQPRKQNSSYRRHGFFLYQLIYNHTSTHNNSYRESMEVELTFFVKVVIICIQTIHHKQNTCRYNKSPDYRHNALESGFYIFHFCKVVKYHGNNQNDYKSRQNYTDSSD